MRRIEKGPPCAGCGRSISVHPWRSGEGWDGTTALIQLPDDGRVFLVHYSDFCLDSWNEAGPSPTYVAWRAKMLGRDEGRPTTGHPS